MVLIGQPAENVGGAQAMLADGLFTRFRNRTSPLRYTLTPMEAGKISYTPGYSMANSRQLRSPFAVWVVMARDTSQPRPDRSGSATIVALQTIVSRENIPLDPAVVTVGSIHGGAEHNIIPDEVKLLLTVRSTRKTSRTPSRLNRAHHEGSPGRAGIPDDRAPIVKLSETEYTPATYNNPQLTERLARVFEKTLGAGNVVNGPPVMAAEDLDDSASTSRFRVRCSGLVPSIRLKSKKS